MLQKQTDSGELNIFTNIDAKIGIDALNISEQMRLKLDKK